MLRNVKAPSKEHSANDSTKVPMAPVVLWMYSASFESTKYLAMLNSIALDSASRCNAANRSEASSMPSGSMRRGA